MDLGGTCRHGVQHDYFHWSRRYLVVFLKTAHQDIAIGSLIQAGADILVVGAAIFLSENPGRALGELMRVASESSVAYRV